MLRSSLRAPLFWILAVSVALRLAGLCWGLPASDGWDDDGFAPRNFLTALALTWKPGAFFTYPPLHALLLAIPTLPGAIIALLHAPSLNQAGVVGEITRPGYMTYFAVTARLVNIAMSLGIIWCAGEMARLVAGRRAGLLASCACALNMGLVYYGQVSNLDVPYLFWAMLSLLACMRAIVAAEPRRFWPAALLAAAAVATKDQAYAVFALSVPAILLLWFAADAWPRRNARAVMLVLVPAALAALAALLLVDGAITNPAGFARRIAFLMGPASQDYAAYEYTIVGRIALLRDAGLWFLHGAGGIACMLAAAGLALHLARFVRNRGVWTAGLLPLFAIISFTVCFNFAALRTDDRFLLPQAIFATIYIGIAADWLAFAANRWVRYGARAGLAAAALFALYQCAAIGAAMWNDPRYDAERWMAANLHAGDTIEIYGPNCFLPRFPRIAAVTRVGEGELTLRNPLPGVTERKAPFSQPRNPHFILVTGSWMQRYLGGGKALPPGRVHTRLQQADLRNKDARGFFAALDGGRLHYRLAYVARRETHFWPRPHIHDSLDEPIGIYERAP